MLFRSVIAGRQALRGIQDAQNLGETLHAIGQGFYRTLPQDTAEAYAQWLGYKDAATYEAIDQRYRKKKLTAKEVERYEAAADRFRVELESYLAKGKFDYDFEPVLIQARQYLNGVYRAVRDSLPPSDTESLLAYRISGGELRGILDQIPDNRDYGSYGSLLAKYEREGRDGRLSVRSRLGW